MITVNEQSLMSFSTDLDNLTETFARLSIKEVSLYEPILLEISDCLHLAKIQLGVLLTSNEETSQLGLDFGNT